MQIEIPDWLLKDIDEYLRLRVIPDSEFPGEKSICCVNLTGHIGERLTGLVCHARVSSKAAEAAGPQEDLRAALRAGADEAEQWRENGIKGGAVEWRIGLEVLTDKLRKWAAPAAPSERGDEQIPWDKLTTLTNKVCDRYGISHYPEEAPGDFDFCEGSIAWLAVEAYRLGRAGLSSQEGK